MKTFFTVLAIVCLVLIAGFLLRGWGLVNFKFWAPKYEDAKREVFTHTRSYVEGKIQELAKLKLEYDRSGDETEKEALASTIRHSFAEMNSDHLPYKLKIFLQEIRSY